MDAKDRKYINVMKYYYQNSYFHNVFNIVQGILISTEQNGFKFIVFEPALPLPDCSKTELP